MASSSLRHLLRDESSYHAELAMQERSIARKVEEAEAATSGDGNSRSGDGDEEAAVERGNRSFY